MFGQWALLAKRAVTVLSISLFSAAQGIDHSAGKTFANNCSRLPVCAVASPGLQYIKYSCMSKYK